MSSGGRLSTAERTALAAGARIRQTFEIGVPTSSGGGSYVYYDLDEGLHAAEGSAHRVLKAGKRKHEVWNPHPTQSERPRAPRHTIVAANDDGLLYPGVTGSLFTIPSVYTAEPPECLLRHRVYVWAAGAWSEIGHLLFYGRISEVRYEDLAGPDGSPASAVAIITATQRGAWEVLARVWTPEDGDHHPMTHPDYPTTGLDFVWST